MSDLTPIVPASAPPHYTEEKDDSAPNKAAFTEAPPPYTPPTSSAYSYNHVIPQSPNYERFDSHQNVITIVHLGPDPIQLQCPKCGQMITTTTIHKSGILTFISAGLCFLFCFVCTLLPFCVNELQDVEHRCPVCGYIIGTYTRI